MVLADDESKEKVLDCSGLDQTVIFYTIRKHHFELAKNVTEKNEENFDVNLNCTLNESELILKSINNYVLIFVAFN